MANNSIYAAFERMWQHISAALEKKVSMVDGKELSTNDYTNEDKAKLDAVPETISDGELIPITEYTEDDIQVLWDSVIV